MRKLIYSMSVSLDGFVESADGDLNWGYPDEELHRHFNDQEAMNDYFLYGRKMYELMSAFWPTVDQNPSAPDYVLEYARIWKNKPKIVFSKTLTKVEWNSRLFSGDIKEEITKLKEQPGNNISVAGPGLASTFIQLGLIDEYWVYIHPIVLGAGKPMFNNSKNQIKLQLIETHSFKLGVVLLKYRFVK